MHIQWKDAKDTIAERPELVLNLPNWLEQKGMYKLVYSLQNIYVYIKFILKRGTHRQMNYLMF